MAFDYTQGDPKLIINNEGADLENIGGQPVMDQGLENAALISLHTREDWWGNAVLPDVNQHVGSEFEAVAEQAITLTAIQRIQSAAERALKWMLDTRLASRVAAVVTNPNSARINTTILIEPPGRDVVALSVEKNGANWIAQKLVPAHKRVTTQ